MLNWQTEAVAIAERAAARAIEDSGVVDASVCHGSAGLAHIFNRLYQATGSPVLHAAAELLGIRLLDHLILGDQGRWYSFQDAGGLAQRPQS